MASKPSQRLYTRLYPDLCSALDAAVKLFPVAHITMTGADLSSPPGFNKLVHGLCKICIPDFFELPGLRILLLHLPGLLRRQAKIEWRMDTLVHECRIDGTCRGNTSNDKTSCGFNSCTPNTLLSSCHLLNSCLISLPSNKHPFDTDIDQCRTTRSCTC